MDIYSTRGVDFQNPIPQVKGVENRTNLLMQASHPLHMQPSQQAHPPSKSDEGFAGALKDALSSVESLDAKSHQLSSQAVYDPDSVEVHDVLIAAEKARFALNLTKTLADNLVRSYRELTSPR